MHHLHSARKDGRPLKGQGRNTIEQGSIQRKYRLMDNLGATKTLVFTINATNHTLTRKALTNI